MPPGLDALAYMAILGNQIKAPAIEAILNHNMGRFQGRLVRVIVCLNQPRFWRHHKELPSMANRVVVGWGPDHVIDTFSKSRLNEFREVAKGGNVVAVGEAGLDFWPVRPEEGHVEQQKRALREILGVAIGVGKPIVLAGRDLGSGEVWEELLGEVRDVLPPRWPILLHAYTGSLLTLFKWLQAFPQLRVGLSPRLLVDALVHPSLFEAVKALDRGRFLLESEAPRLCPPTTDLIGSGGVPGLIFAVARKVGQLRGEDPGDVVRASVGAACRFYCL